MSRRAIKGEPSAETLRKRRYRAAKRRMNDPAGYYLLRHNRKLAKRQPEPHDPTLDWDEFLASQPKSMDEWMAADGARAITACRYCGGPTPKRKTPRICCERCKAAGAWRGNIPGQRKLTASQAREIRYSGEPPTVVAKYFGISQSEVSLIRLGRRWRHA